MNDLNGCKACIIFIISFFLSNAKAQFVVQGNASGFKSNKDTIELQLKNKDLNWSTKLSVHSNNYSFENIPAGNYVFIVVGNGYVSVVDSLNVIANLTRNIELRYKNGLQEVVVQSVKPIDQKKNDDLITFDQITNAKRWVSKRQIELLGSQRLDEVLKEQLGVTVVNDLGAGNRAVGVQMQGFGSDYVKILMDGMPIAGRMDGNLDLSRFSVQDIDHIEIIKGATSALYGADAMGGVINIITNQNAAKRAVNAGVSYGSFETKNINVGYTNPFGKRNSFYQIKEDYYQTNGFNASPQYLEGGQTSPPYTSNTIQGRARFELNDHDNINVSGRYAFRNGLMTRNYGDNYVTLDKLNDNDLNLLTSWNHTINNHSQFLVRYYLTHYYSSEQVSLQNRNSSLQNFRFGEWDNHLEGQYHVNSNDKKWDLISGLGAEFQQLQGYENAQSGHQVNSFVYGQLKYVFSSTINATVGARGSHNSIYGGKVTPTAGLNWNPIKHLYIRPSFGMGFKSPTYVQMNQVFTNLSQGYTVVGANVVSSALAALDSAGQISSIWAVASTIKNLKAETSHSFNLDAKWEQGDIWSLEANVFYNHIENMIFTEQIGIKTNGSQIFSYVNLAKVVNKGLELYGSVQPLKGLHLAANYQLLYSQDLSVLDSIKAGKLTVRSNPMRIATSKDYFNLPNRSRNMLQLQLFYDNKNIPWAGSIRANYRGKFGFMDLDNNGFIDPYDIYVPGYWFFNASVQRVLLKNKNLRIQFSVDNITNRTNYLMPYQAGRNYKLGFL